MVIQNLNQIVELFVIGAVSFTHVFIPEYPQRRPRFHTRITIKYQLLSQFHLK